MTTNLRSALDALTDGVAILDNAGVVLFANDAWLVAGTINAPLLALGAPGTDYLAECSALVGDIAEARDRVCTAVRQLLGGMTESVELEYHRVVDSGDRWFRVRTSVFRDDGEVRALITHTDITSSRMFREELRESEDRYRSLVELLPDGVLIHEEGTITYANPPGALLLGASSPHELVGQHNLRIVHPDDHASVTRRLAQLSEGHVQPISEQRWVGLDGTQRTVEVMSRSITYAGRPATITIFRDVSERKRLEARLGQVQKMDALGRLAGGIAHDFNNLLGVMMSYTGVLMEDTPSSDSRQDDLREIQNAIERAAALTSQLLAFGRQQPQRRERVDIGTAITASAKLIRRLIGEDITLEVGIRSPVTLEADLDVGQLEQVLLNLALNARDAMPRGGGLSITLSATSLGTEECSAHDISPGEFAHIAVSDTGVGIDKETMARIFDPFFTTKEVGRGPGLGLATIYGIMAQSNGFVTVESHPGDGATFHLYFPLAGDEDRTVHGTPVRGVDEPSMPAASILLVEDEEALRRATKRVLQAEGFEVTAAATPAEALTLAKGDLRIDCLVTDVVMPGMSGQELAERVRDLRGRIPVLLLSGYARDAVEQRGALSADMPLLNKPFRPADLARAVGGLLGQQSGQ